MLTFFLVVYHSHLHMVLQMLRAVLLEQCWQQRLYFEALWEPPIWSEPGLSFLCQCVLLITCWALEKMRWHHREVQPYKWTCESFTLFRYCFLHLFPSLCLSACLPSCLFFSVCGLSLFGLSFIYLYICLCFSSLSLSPSPTLSVSLAGSVLACLCVCVSFPRCLLWVNIAGYC